MFTPRPPKGGHLVIRSPQATGHATRVWLNGQEISHCLQAVTLTIRDASVTHADLTIAVSHVDVDAQTLASLAALVEAQKPVGEARDGA
jgi:hypothetical protein